MGWGEGGGRGGDFGGRGMAGGGGGGLLVGVYRSELSLDLKQSSDSAVTTSWGSPFQSGMVLGKNDICLYCVLQDGMSQLQVLFFLLELSLLPGGFGR